MPERPIALAIVTPLDEGLVSKIRAAVPGARYDGALLPEPRYPGDHRGDPAFRRDAEREARFRAMLADADVVLGIPGESPDGLRALLAHAPGLRWVQSMYAGSGETVRAAELPREVLERVAFTTTSGVHGTMLAEFAFYGILALRKDARRLERVRLERNWTRFPLGELRGETLVVVGTGHIGRTIARIGRAFGMHVLGVARSAGARDGFDEMLALDALDAACARADVLALALPGTAATQRLIGEREFAVLRPNTIVVNVGRGATLDQAALTRALAERRIAGAVLDVFDPEPLPPDDPLWAFDNVVLAPHTATLSIHENERIVDLFLDNLARYERGEALRNRVDIDEFY